ncbi:MAG TPA: ATP-binding protein [Caulobacteraceae bacterium]
MGDRLRRRAGRDAAPAGGAGEGAPERRPGSLSFQNRIAVVALLTAIAVLSAATSLFIWQEWRTDRARLIQHRTVLAQITAEHLKPALAARDWRAAEAELRTLAVSPRVMEARLVGPGGRELARYRRTDAKTGGQRIEVEAPVAAAGSAPAKLVLISTHEGLGQTAPRFIALGGSLFFVAAGLALFMGRWLAGRVTRPVNRLSAAMREVARSGDFAQQVEGGDDEEFIRLSESFNHLLAQLHRNDMDLRAAMAELVEARDAAQAANVLKSHFLANMSHEIRTPLNGVLAMAQIMAMGELSGVQRERLDVISRSGEALLGVLNDVLDLSKIEAGRMELEPVVFEARTLADELSAHFAPLAEQKGLRFQLTVEPSAAGPRRGDCQRLLQVLNNLLSNAVKFTEHGRVEVMIAGEGEGGATGLRATVTDTGIGVAADKLPLLFQKFSQLDSSNTRRFGGTGLGLAICREIAHLMGGDVWAESEPGRGSTFHVSVPLERLEAEEAQPPKPAAGEAAATARSAPAEEERPLKVLAAEDNATNQLVLKSVMATFGVELQVAPHGRAAVDAWAQETFDVILMDIQMPEMDGIAATRMIRAAEAETGRRRTPIIALSANAMTHQVKEYLAAGMDRHVAKPIELAKLHAALLSVLEDAGEVQEPAALSA